MCRKCTQYILSFSVCVWGGGRPGSRGTPPETFENLEYRRSHLTPSKFLNWPEFCIFLYYSETKVPIILCFGNPFKT